DEAALQALGRRAVGGLARGVGDQRRVDADREVGRAKAFAAGQRNDVVIAYSGIELVLEIFAQRVQVLRGLQADQVVRAQRAEQLAMMRQRGQQLGRG